VLHLVHRRWLACGLALPLGLLGATSCSRPTAGARTSPLLAADPYPHRIVSLNCNATDILLALGAIDRVIAVEEDCPTCGTEGKILIRNDDHMGKQKPLCVESVLALRPDAVFTRLSMRELFESCGVRVLTNPVRQTLQTLPDYVRSIGGFVGTPDRAEQVLLAMQATQQRIATRCRDLPRVTVYYESTTLGATATRGSVMHDMIELAGGVNIAQDLDRRTGPMTNEAIVAADPEVIVLSPFADPIEAIKLRPGWHGLRAVRSGRVHMLPLAERYVALATPRCVDGCERFLVPWLHPELATKESGR
jgi:iron complex transport system substrate-binding protein